MGRVVNATRQALYPRVRDPVPITQNAGWDLGTVWTGEENAEPTGIRSPDHPGQSQLSYPSLQVWVFSARFKVRTVKKATCNGRKVPQRQTANQTKVTVCTMYRPTECCQGVWRSGTWRCVAGSVFPDVSKNLEPLKMKTTRSFETSGT